MEINIINHSNHQLPSYQTIASAGMDLRANISTSIVLEPLQRTLINTGLFIELPNGFEAQVRPRSGMAYKKGVTVLNAPGTIDADYRGEIGVLLVNLSNSSVEIQDGDRIAQLVISRHETIRWKEVEELVVSQRGVKGFGSTGEK